MTPASTLRALLLSLMLGLSAGPASAEGFLASLDDVPLMPGLTERPAAALLFDAPSGRIAEAEAEGAVSADKILTFYGATLPELGWEKIGQTAWRRDAETLTINIRADGRRSLVHFAIAPH